MSCVVSLSFYLLLSQWAVSSDKDVHPPPTSLSYLEKADDNVGVKVGEITGRAGIINHHILNNRRHVLTQDDASHIQLWDVTTVCILHVPFF